MARLEGAATAATAVAAAAPGKRARISDSPIIIIESQPPSSNDDNDDDDDDDDGEEEDSDDNDDDSDDNDDKAASTRAHCVKCSAHIGDFYNLWVKLAGSTSYYLPSMLGSYSATGVNGAGKPHLALGGSELEGCTIQPLACSQCKEYLGIVCHSAPETKPSYSGREFFKLPRLKLRCESSGKLVEPRVEEVRTEPGDRHHTRVISEAMEAVATIQRAEPDLRQPSAHAVSAPILPPILLPPSTSQSQHQPPPLPRSHLLRENTHSPPNHKLPPPIHQHTPTLPPVLIPKESTPAPQDRPRDHIVPVTEASDTQRLSNGQRYPSPHDVQLDAISRMQTQINYNTATLSHQQRDIERINDAVTRLQQEMRHAVDMIDVFRRELLQAARPPTAPSTGSTTAQQDAMLELFANNLSNVAAKANEVDVIKIQIEILKKKVQRLEDAPVSTAPTSAAYSSPREGPPHGANGAHHTPSISNLTTPMRPEHRPASSYHNPSTTEQGHTLEPDPQLSAGWVSVNPSSKRALPNGTEGHPDFVGHAIGSPKRPKLAPIEPRVDYHAGPHPPPYERMDTEEVDPRAQSRESFCESTPSQFIQYSANEVVSDDNWSADPQRGNAPPGTHSPRSRGRGGPRGGRPRKSLPTDLAELSTPEWDKPEWNGSQTGPENYYLPLASGNARRASIVRRGSGGGGTASTRPIDMARHSDPYAHTKKTRTKPTRNADGILIRKDGRPDMRSQSSAANLRKVHARKEQERAIDRQTTPSALAPAPTHTIMTESPSPVEQSGETNAQDRHEAIMKQMFPRGIDEARGRHSYAKQLFASSSTSPVNMKMKLEKENSVDTMSGVTKDATEGTNGSTSGSEGQDRSPEGERSPGTTQTLAAENGS